MYLMLNLRPVKSLCSVNYTSAQVRSTAEWSRAFDKRTSDPGHHVSSSHSVGAWVEIPLLTLLLGLKVAQNLELLPDRSWRPLWILTSTALAVKFAGFLGSFWAYSPCVPLYHHVSKTCRLLSWRKLSMMCRLMAGDKRGVAGWGEAC